MTLSPSFARLLALLLLFAGLGQPAWADEAWQSVGPEDDLPIRRLAPNSQNPAELLAQSFAELWLTDNGGATWTLTLLSNDVARAPSRPEIVYARQVNNIRRSEDGGRTWGEPLGYTFPGLLAETEGRLRVDPADADVLYATPRNSRDAGRRQIFLVRSDDGGATWTEITPEPLISERFMPLPIEPVPVFAPGIPGSLYVLGPSGLWHTTDRGETWALVPPPAAAPIATFAVHPRRPGLLLAAAEDAGLFRTANRGDAWTEAEIPVDPTLPAQELLFHPALPRVAFAVYGTRLLASHDGGNTWDFADEGLPRDAPLRLTPDERSPFILYVQAEVRGLFRSLDGGESWHPFDQGLEGLVHFDGPLAVLSGRPVTLYLGTDRGVWTRQETRWLRAVRPRVAPAGN